MINFEEIIDNNDNLELLGLVKDLSRCILDSMALMEENKDHNNGEKWYLGNNVYITDDVKKILENIVEEVE